MRGKKTDCRYRENKKRNKNTVMKHQQKIHHNRQDIQAHRNNTNALPIGDQFTVFLDHGQQNGRGILLVKRILLLQRTRKQILYHPIMACILQIPKIVLKHTIGQEKQQNKDCYHSQILKRNRQILQRNTVNRFLHLDKNCKFEHNGQNGKTERSYLLLS